jgi:hypothetical protein
MKKIFIALFAASSVLFADCTKPTKDLEISISPKVFDNIVSVKFYNAATPGVAPKNVTLTISGQDANSIYEISGRKVFTVVDGVISLGVHPNAKPTAGRPSRFVLEAEAPGYLPVRIPITVLEGQETKLVAVSMVNMDAPPPGVKVAKKTTPLTGGATTTPETISTTPAGTGQESAAVEIPSGTRFLNAAGTAITGTALNTTLVHFNTREAASLNAFPGNGFHSDNIKDASGNIVSGIFRTAGFCNIMMSIGSTAVRSFDQPITVRIGVNSQQTNPQTGAPFVAGDVIPVWSYQGETGAWTYEKQGTVTNNAGKLEVAFTTNHLTYYNLAFLENACTSATVTFNTGITAAESYLVDIYPANETEIPAIASYVIQVGNLFSANFENVPEGNVTMKVYRNTASNSQTNWKKRDAQPLATYSGTLCGNNPTVNLNMPPLKTITFDIEGKCSNNPAKPYVRPSVDVWYRYTGSGDEYMLLGHVNQGKFQTTNLDYQGDYDFRVIWGASKVFLKTRNVDSMAYNRTIVVPQQYEQHFCN